MLTTRILAFWLAASLLAGCVGPQIQPRAGAISQIRSIYIVPMETRPLSVDLAYATSGTSSIVHFLPRYTIGMARTVGVLSGVAMLLELPELINRRQNYPLSVQNQIGPTETWFLTVELSREASRLVAATGKTPIISPEIQPIPGIQERGRTFLMENWMAPIRAWYNDTLPSPRYASITLNGIGAVAEIGISNYEIYSGKLLLQVHVKLIDPASGQLLGRARASSFSELPSMDEVFAADAKLFKELTSRAGNQLLVECLHELGIESK